MAWLIVRCRTVADEVREQLRPFLHDIHVLEVRLDRQRAKIRQLEGSIMNVREYAEAVDAETNRIADALEDLKGQLATDDANDQAELDAAFAPVLERLRGVGVSGETAPPAEEEPAPVEEAPAEEAPADPAPSSDGDLPVDENGNPVA